MKGKFIARTTFEAYKKWKKRLAEKKKEDEKSPCKSINFCDLADVLRDVQEHFGTNGVDNLIEELYEHSELNIVFSQDRWGIVEENKPEGSEGI